MLASRFFDTGLDILADALFRTRRSIPAELERELKVVLEEVKQGEDNPSRVATQTLFATAYTKHPYRRPVIGYTKTVKSFTRERLLDFFHRYYVANNITLVVVGDFDPQKAQQKIAAALGGAPTRPLARRARRAKSRRRSRRASRSSPATCARPTSPSPSTSPASTTTTPARSTWRRSSSARATRRGSAAGQAAASSW